MNTNKFLPMAYFARSLSPLWIFVHVVEKLLIRRKKQKRDLAEKERECTEIYQSRLKVYHKTDGLTTA